jgi:DNA modification methylase
MIKTFYNKQREKIGTIFLGNSLEILPSLERNSAEIAITSPPYNLNKRHQKGTSSISHRMIDEYSNWYDDDSSEWIYQGQQQEIIYTLLKICRSSIFYNHRIRYAWHPRNIYHNENKIHHPMHWLHRFPIWCEIVWNRMKCSHPSRRYNIQDERIYQIGRPRQWHNERSLTNIWSIPPSDNEGHVCSFPEKLVENCLLPTTREGDTIIDPYLGSGTTAIVAIKHNRKFIGIEQEQKYFDLAISKIEKEIQKPKQVRLF